jgi:hypothetical protein
VECAALVERLRDTLSKEIAAGDATLIPGDVLSIDFARGTVVLGGETFRFVPLGRVPQALVAAGGIENQIRERLGLNE